MAEKKIKRKEAVLAAIKEKGARWTAGENPVPNLSDEQKQHLLGLVRSTKTKERLERHRIFKEQKGLEKAPVCAPMGTGVPASWDWRNALGGHDWTTPPKDQGQCGSCVSFSTVGALEALYKILKGDSTLKPNYSEAHLFFCNNRHCHQKLPDGNDDPLYGWDAPEALDYIRDYGVPDDSCFPYTDHDQPCNTCTDWKQKATHITGWKTISSSDEMKKWLSTRGPLVTGFDVYEDFQHYNGGVYSHVYGVYQGGHCVLVVGYNDADQCWICKNSWFGTQWGEGGFFRIEYGQCNIDAEMYAISGIQNLEPTPTPICPPAPLIPICPPNPVVHYCPPAPLTPICPPNPVVHYCPPAPLKPICPPNPVVHYCPPAPRIICPPAPILRCPPLPIYYPPGPITPYGTATPAPEETLVQVTICVPKSTADAWTAYAAQQPQISQGAAPQYGLCNPAPILPCPPAPILICPPAPHYCPPTPIHCPPLPIHCPPLPIHCPPLPIHCPPAPFYCPPEPVYYPPGPISPYGVAGTQAAPQYGLCPPAPILICPPAPHYCPPAPIHCPPAPHCLPAPIINCPAPFWCPPGIMPLCPPAPHICPPAPFCPPAPHICPPGHVPTCQPGPFGPCHCPPAPLIQPGAAIPTPEEPLVQVTICVPKSVADAWMAYGQQTAQISPESAHQYAQKAAEQAYCVALEELGMSGEYASFPGVEGCMRGPYRPQYTE